ncbi:MAG: pyridoxal-phosphate dependent enzyme [bacterium]
MHYKVYNNSPDVVTEEKLSSVRKFSNPIAFEIPQNVYQINLAKRINELYVSTIDAKKTLLSYKADLSTAVDFKNDCLTPLTESTLCPMLFYKREDLTSIKAYKVRGAFYQMSKILEQNNSPKLKFVAASTGNHALGVLKTAEILRTPNVTICVSECTTDFKKQELKKRIFNLKAKGINAELIVSGQNFDQTNQFAQKIAEADKYSFYIDPYNTHNAVAGQGTIGLELLTQLESKQLNKLKELTVIVPIGGGGLISGIACALKSGIKQFPSMKNLKLRIIGVSLRDLNSVYGDAIKVKAVGSHNDEYINYFVEKMVKIDDIDMVKGINFVYNDFGVKVEGASAGTLKPIFENIVTPSEANAVVCILSGGNI